MKIRIYADMEGNTESVIDSGTIDTEVHLGFKPGEWELLTNRGKHRVAKEWVRENGLSVHFEEYL